MSEIDQKDLYYQATKSGTKFYSKESDPEECGLEDYRKNEKETILKFRDSSNQILVIGGTSSTSKTHFLKEMENQYDLYMCVDSHSAAEGDYEEGIMEALPNTNTFIFEEMFHVISKDELVKKFNNDIIQPLIENDKKIILAGGGNQYTSKEQTEIIAEKFGKDFKTKLLPFEFQTLNIKQSRELIKNLFTKWNIIDKENKLFLLEEENLDIIAKSYLPYFRFTRSIHLTAGNFLSYNNFNPYYDTFIPKEIHNKIKVIQEEKLRETYELLHKGK